MIVNASAKGLAGVGFTDHGVLSGHVKVERFKKSHPEYQGLVTSYGSEIYLVDRDKVERARKTNAKTKFYHFVLTARTRAGYQLLRKISTRSWRDSFWHRGMRRLPTYKDDLAEIMRGHHGDIIASTACLGSELSNLILDGVEADSDEVKDDVMDKTVRFIKYLTGTFGKDNVYFELMPSSWDDQKTVNRNLVRLSKGTGIKYIITTDSHYVDGRDKDAHEVFLHSENRDRDVDGYYHFAHLFSFDELRSYFPEDVLQTGAKNSLDLMRRLQPIPLHHKQEIPKSPIPKFKPVNLSVYNVDWEKYPYINMFVHSEYKINRFFMRLVFNGLDDRHQKLDSTNLDRINTELHVLRAVSDYMGDEMANYFWTELNIIDVIWKSDSLVGPGRGSVGCFYLAFLTHITEVNAVKHGLPYWRFLSVERKDSMPDIDEDSQGGKRNVIIENLRKLFGFDKVINFGTVNTEADRSTILSSARGLGLDYRRGQNIVDTLPKDKLAGSMPVRDALFGNKKKGVKPVKPFIRAVSKVKGLKSDILNIVGTVKGVSEHASGVYISNHPYTRRNAMMMTQKGIPITQLDASDSAYTGALKYDILSLNALDRIHLAIDLLLADGKIKWQGSLYKTYMHYFGVDKLDLTSKGMYDMLFRGDVINAFEFSTLVGRDTLRKLKPQSIDELTAGNALMRLRVDHGEQPIDKYIRRRADINEWYKDMEKAGLTKSEQQVLIDHLSRFYGVCFSQEALMDLSMDKRLTGFGLLEANALRKGIAKKDHRIFENERKHFYAKGRQHGNRTKFLDYVWNNCAEPAKNYSFNLAHGYAYSYVCEVEMNICYRFGSLYWKTACLSVNAGINGRDSLGSPNYTKLARATGELNDLVANPDINKSGYGFKPDVKNHQILYGLYSISGIGAKDCADVIKKRPYSSFRDFVKRSSLTKRKVIQLVKSGAFDSFCSDRRKVMVAYVSHIVPVKKRLTTVQIPKVRDYIPAKYNGLVTLYDFRDCITGRHKVPMNQTLEKAFFKLYEPKITAEYGRCYSFRNGKLAVDVKVFNRWYNKVMKPLKDWLKTSGAIRAEHAVKCRAVWVKYCLGNVSSWEFDSLQTYILPHELTLTDIADKYPVDDYGKISEPKVMAWRGYPGHKFPVFEHQLIYGSVLGKNVNKALVYLLTPSGIANVRVGKQRYPKYNKKITRNHHIVKDSWFGRGNKLLITGYKRGANFFVNNKHTGFQHSIYKIDGYSKHAKVVSV